MIRFLDYVEFNFCELCLVTYLHEFRNVTFMKIILASFNHDHKDDYNIRAIIIFSAFFSNLFTHDINDQTSPNQGTKVFA